MLGFRLFSHEQFFLMPHLAINLPAPLLAQASWMTSWLTPIWFLAMGIVIGLAVLGLLVLLFRGLSQIPMWEQLSESPWGHLVAGLITAGLTYTIWRLLPESFLGSQELSEPTLLLIALALVCSIFGWSLVYCSSRKSSLAAFATLGEGAAGLLGITALVIVFIGASIWGVGLVTQNQMVADPIQALTSIPQLFSTGVQVTKVNIDGVPAGDGPFVEVPLDIDFERLTSLSIASDTTVVLADAADPKDFQRAPTRLGAGISEAIEWKSQQKQTELPIPAVRGASLYVQNQEVQPTANFDLDRYPTASSRSCQFIDHGPGSGRDWFGDPVATSHCTSRLGYRLCHRQE